jgi:hypothetical protein
MLSRSRLRRCFRGIPSRRDAAQPTILASSGYRESARGNGAARLARQPPLGAFAHGGTSVQHALQVHVTPSTEAGRTRGMFQRLARSGCFRFISSYSATIKLRNTSPNAASNTSRGSTLPRSRKCSFHWRDSTLSGSRRASIIWLIAASLVRTCSSTSAYCTRSGPCPSGGRHFDASSRIFPLPHRECG